jgi:hypothetical protein
MIVRLAILEGQNLGRAGMQWHSICAFAAIWTNTGGHSVLKWL